MRVVRRMGMWLDVWCVRCYQNNTADWWSKQEIMRSVRRTGRLAS